MSNPRSYQTEAIIIKKTKLGEADSIHTLYTPDMGKIQGFAKSLRRPRSKLAGHLELLTHSLVSLARGRNLDTITGSQTINSFLPLRSDLWLTSCGLYVAEMTSQFTADHVRDEGLFRLLLQTLERICQINNREMVLRHFELGLLERSGYRPELRECVSCHAPLRPVVNSFSAGAGGVLCPDCAASHPLANPISVNALKVLRLLQSDQATAFRLRVDAALSDELERTLAGYIEHILERSVKSAAWLAELKEQLSFGASAALPRRSDDL